MSYAAPTTTAADRIGAAVNVGTNGGTRLYAAGDGPARSDTVLVTSYTYNAAGWQDNTYRPAGLVDGDPYDALGRVTKTIQDYTDGTPDQPSNADHGIHL